MKKIYVLYFFMLLSFSSYCDEIRIYVRPDGNYNGLGTEEKPFDTISRARDVIRALRAEGNHNPATVNILPGIYNIIDPIQLDKRDSNITFCAKPTGKARLIGGMDIKLKLLRPVEDENILKRLPGKVKKQVRIIDCFIGWEMGSKWPDAFRGYAGWPEVFIDGKPLRLARWPNKGYATIDKVIDRGSRPRYKEKPDRAGVFRFKEKEPATWNLDQEIFLGGYWCYSWYDEVLRVKSIDPEKKEIHFAVPHIYGIGGPSKGKYYSINVLETLDELGEYVYDTKSKKIYVLLPENEIKECIVGLLNAPLVRVETANDVKFKGIQFEAGKSSGIEIINCKNTVVENCVIRNFPKNGINIKGGENCGVKNSEIYGLGMAGITLQGGDRSTLTPSGHYAIDNEIHHYARLVQTYKPGIRLSGVGNRAAYNYIHNAPHQAIAFSGNDNIIENNRIEDVCLDTGDAGAVYCGRDWTLQGNIIRKNWFSKIGKGSHNHNWAIYPDDQSSGITARHNIIVDCPSGFLFGGGRDNVIEENLFVKVGKWPIRFDKRGISWKGKHDKILLKRLAQIPVDKEPWKTRFPTLVGLSKDPKRNWPAGNIIKGNIAVNSASDNIDVKVKECSKVEDTLEIKSEWMPTLKNGTVFFPDNGPELPDGFKGMTIGPRSEH